MLICTYAYMLMDSKPRIALRIFTTHADTREFFDRPRRCLYVVILHILIARMPRERRGHVHARTVAFGTIGTGRFTRARGGGDRHARPGAVRRLERGIAAAGLGHAHGSVPRPRRCPTLHPHPHR